MKRLYHRPTGLSRATLLGLAGLAALLLFLVEFLPRRIQEEGYEEKLRAAQKADQAFAAVREERKKQGLPPFESADRAKTGLIGPTNTEITTTTGSLVAKRTTANPHFASLVVQFLSSLEVEEGDWVAVGVSGSFPALNIAVFAATETLGLRPVVIASAAASDYGASSPRFTWLDMESALVRRSVFSTRSIAASLGGIEDQGRGLSDAGLQFLREAIERNGVLRIEAPDFTSSLSERMRIYDEAAQGASFRAYINVGGGTVSVGRSSGKAAYKPGINYPQGKAPVDSIIGRFLDRGVPVIHLSRIEELAKRYGLPVDPPQMQPLGEASLLARSEPNPWLVGGGLGVLLLALVGAGWRARKQALAAGADES